MMPKSAEERAAAFIAALEGRVRFDIDEADHATLSHFLVEAFREIEREMKADLPPDEVPMSEAAKLLGIDALELGSLVYRGLLVPSDGAGFWYRREDVMRLKETLAKKMEET